MSRTNTGSAPPIAQRNVGALEGIGCLLKGIFVALGERQVRGKIVMAVIANAFAFAVVFGLLMWGAFALTDGWVDDGGLLAAAGWLARIGLIVGFGFVAPVLFALSGEIVVPTFRGKIFELARDFEGGPPVNGSEGLVAEAKAVGVDIRRLVRFLGISLLLLPLLLIPGVGTAGYAAVQLAVAARTMGWDILGRHFELHGVRYADQKRFLNRHMGLTLGVGLVALGLCLVPVAQFVFVSTNVAGAGILSARLDGVRPR